MTSTHRPRLQRLRGRAYRPSRRPSRYVAQPPAADRGEPTEVRVGRDHEHREEDWNAAVRGERRQVTVLFCDLVGSTELSGQLDPEELCEVMRQYQATCAHAIAPFGGYIAQTLGDGLLVYFGFPEAHEDDAQRAVSAGLAAVAAVSDEKGPLAAAWKYCAARAGIHTGLVYAGEVGRFDTRADRALIGETPNIAARLQNIAGRNEVLVGPTTRKLIQGQFRFESLGPRPLKGLKAPLEVFRVSNAPEAVTRFRGRARSNFAPLIGRTRELAALREQWALAREGQGQQVLIAGVAGIGKSRLVETLRSEIGRSALTLSFQCSPYFQHTALYPLVAQLRRVASIRRRDSDASKLDKLERLLRDSSARAERNLGLIARLLQIAAPVAPELSELSPQRLLDDTIDLMVERFVALSRLRPLLVLIEDAHWSDPLSRRLIGELAARTPDAPVMLVITERGGHAELSRLKRMTAMRLTPLPPDEATSFIAHLAKQTRLPRRVADEIVRRSEGIPLFIEELTKSVLESSDEPTAPRVPASLQDSLTARLDRLGPYRVIAQRGACIGNTFSYSMISYVTGLDRDALERGLSKLVETGLVSPSGEPPDARFTFRHGLLQDAAYESMLLQERRAVHLAIARKLEREHPTICQQEPELLARHFAAAEAPRTAAEYWLRAGEVALDRSANVDAMTHLGHGLRALEALERTPSRDELEIQLQSALARSHMAGEGWPGRRVHAAYSRARELSRGLGKTQKECEILWGLCAHLCVRGAFSEAAVLAREYVELAQREEDRTALLMADSAALMAHFCSGNFTEAQHHADRIDATYRDSDDRHFVQTYNHDPTVNARMYQSVWLWVQGYPDAGAAASARGIARARELRHPFSICYALLNGSWVTLLRHEYEPALLAIDEALSISEELRIPLFKVYAPLLGAPALFEREPSMSSLNWFEDCAKRMRSGNAAMHMPLYLCNLASAYDVLGAPIEAQSRITEAIELMERTGERWFEAELWRVRARIALTADPTGDPAEMLLWSALHKARAAGARGFELRVALDLGTLLERRGRRHEVEELVASVFATFDQGRFTLDLQRASAWLARDPDRPSLV
jgi:predicted ATPase/class 3 adenylate cyclase